LLLLFSKTIFAHVPEILPPELIQGLSWWHRGLLLAFLHFPKPESSFAIPESALGKKVKYFNDLKYF
jgi:hypothetical protein